MSNESFNLQVVSSLKLEAELLQDWAQFNEKMTVIFSDLDCLGSSFLRVNSKDLSFEHHLFLHFLLFRHLEL